MNRVLYGAVVLAGAWSVAPGGVADAKTRPAALSADAVNGASFAPQPAEAAKSPTAAVLRAEVLLDRARFSPGAIDGVAGDNFHKAVAAFQAVHGLPTSGTLDQATWSALVDHDGAPVLVERALTTKDIKGPFTRSIPHGFEQQARLKRLGYRTPLEEVAEEVHASQGLLRALNPHAAWSHVGTKILVPQVTDARKPAEVTRVVVDKASHRVDAFGPDNTLVAAYPATIGSGEKPAPTGDFTIRRVIHNPDYTYNPKYAFKGVKAKHSFTIAPGPNNPVGSVWMDLSYEGYGIHGTPDPELVGKTQSHGCIRLTNWDAEDLASMVKPGTPAIFSDTPVPLVPAAAPSPASAPSPVAPAPATAAPDTASQPGSAPNAAPAGGEATPAVPASSVPANPAPAAPAPTQPAPVQPAPAQPAPATQAPVEPAPVTPAPAQPAPAQPAPTTPAPSAPNNPT